MNKLTIKDYDLAGKTVFARLDWNVPVEDGQVTDTFRIEATKPTVDYLVQKGCKVIIASHLGRPDGQADPKFSLKPAADAATEIFGRPVAFVADCVGEAVKEAVSKLQPGDLLCLENVRFHAEEEANDADFAQQLAADTGSQVFVYDAFASYRPHASTEGLAHILPAVSGLLVEQEVDYITGAIEHPKRPLVAIIGGAKVSTKVAILEHLIPKVDTMLLTGPIANTFALAQGHDIGQSVAEPEEVETVKRLMKQAADGEVNTQLLIPEEVVVSKDLKKPTDVRTVALKDVAADDFIVDASPAYAIKLKDVIGEYLDPDGTCTVIWNGPLGVTEVPEFQVGSRAMAEAIMSLKCTSIIGGGDTAGFVDEAGLHDKFTWVSTGGGASLELMSGQGLPCVDALLDRP